MTVHTLMKRLQKFSFAFLMASNISVYAGNVYHTRPNAQVNFVNGNAAINQGHQSNHKNVGRRQANILHEDYNTYHLGDENFRGRKWRPLHGQCYFISFSDDGSAGNYSLSLSRFGTESAAVFLNKTLVGYLPRQHGKRGRHSNFWSQQEWFGVPSNSVHTGQNTLAICSSLVSRPEFPGDVDDFQIRNIRLVKTPSTSHSSSSDNRVSTSSDSYSIEKWKNAGFGNRDISGWKKAGVKTPEEARKWIDSKIKIPMKSGYDVWGAKDYDYVKSWKKQGVKTPQEARKWVEAGISAISTVADWKKIGIITSEEAKKWLDAGVGSYKNVLYCKKIGIASPEELKKWLDLGVKLKKGLFASGYNYVEEWKKIGIESPEEAKKWRDIGVKSPYTITRWRKIGIKTIDEVQKWAEAGVNDYDDIIEWRKVGLTTPEEIRKWLNIGIKNNFSGRELIQTLKRNGVDTPSKVMMWANGGITKFKDIVSWTKAGATTPQEARSWMNVGMNSKNASAWIRLGLTTKEVQEWKDAGIKDYRDLLRWQKAGVTTPKEAKEWITAGFKDSYDVKRWIMAEVMTPKDAKKWKGTGIAIRNIKNWKKIGVSTPEEAVEWVNIGANSSYVVKLLKTLDLTPSDLNEKKTKTLKSLFYNLPKNELSRSRIKDIYKIVENSGCFDDKNCYADRVVNTGKIIDGKLLVSYHVPDNDSPNTITIYSYKYDEGLFNFPSGGWFSSPEIPNFFKLVENRKSVFSAFISETGTTKINGSKVNVCDVIMWWPPDGTVREVGK